MARHQSIERDFLQKKTVQETYIDTFSMYYEICILMQAFYLNNAKNISVA